MNICFLWDNFIDLCEHLFFNEFEWIMKEHVLVFLKKILIIFLFRATFVLQESCLLFIRMIFIL